MCNSTNAVSCNNTPLLLRPILKPFIVRMHQEQTKGDETMYSNIYQHKSCCMTHTQIFPFWGTETTVHLQFTRWNFILQYWYKKQSHVFQIDILFQNNIEVWSFQVEFLQRLLFIWKLMFHGQSAMVSRDSMGISYSLYGMGPVTGGRGLFNIDGVLFRVSNISL